MANKTKTPPRTSGRATTTGSTSAHDPTAKVASEATDARRSRRGRSHAATAGVGVLIALGVAGLVALFAAQPSSQDVVRGGAASPPSLTGDTGLPPWPVPAEPSAGIDAAGLQISDMQAMKTHFHPHLDIIVDGEAIPVAANIGIDPTDGTMSQMHTHDTSGVVHIESDVTDQRYTLGQLFTEWGVRLDRSHLGALSAQDGKALSAYVDGQEVTGNPADIELLAHREIALVYGAPDQQVDVPSSYDFPEGA